MMSYLLPFIAGWLIGALISVYRKPSTSPSVPSAKRLRYAADIYRLVPALSYASAMRMTETLSEEELSSLIAGLSE